MPASTLEVLMLLERVELAMARIYRDMAKAFTGDAEACGLFSRLEMEEQAHAREVVLQRKLHMQSNELKAQATAERRDLLRLLEEIDAVAGAADRLDLADALRLCDAFEGHAAESHYRHSLTAGDEHLSRFTASLGRDDDRHRERLRAFARSRGIGLA